MTTITKTRRTEEPPVIDLDGKRWRTVCTWADAECRWSTLRLCEILPKSGPFHLGAERSLFTFELRISDRKYWTGVRLFLEWLGLALPDGAKWATVTYKLLRYRRFECDYKTYEQALPRDVVKWANGELARYARENQLDCVDSHRVAKVGSKSQWRRFTGSRSCCGSAEWIETCPVDGKQYHLGCNFGH